jgi:DNA transposition AAA+ family ATPase
MFLRGGVIMTDTTEQKPDDWVRVAISKHLQTIPQTRLAREAGVSAPVISGWINGKYKGNNDTVKDKLTAWIATHAQRATVSDAVAPERASWVETPTAKDIERALVLARSLPSIAVVYGAPGVGKTSTLKRHARTAPNVWVVTASPAVGSMAAILKLIGIAVNARGGYRNYDLARDITTRITGTRGLLVIDEFQHLSLPALEQVRAIHGAAEIGIALVGNEAGYAHMTGGTRRLDHAQLFSRCSPVVRLFSPKEDDVNAVLDSWQVTAKAAKDFALQVASGAGGLRVLVKMLEQAALFSPDAAAPDMAAMQAAFAEVGGAI